LRSQVANEKEKDDEELALVELLTPEFEEQFVKTTTILETRRDLDRLYLCLFQKVRLICLEDSKRCLEGFISPRNSLLVIFLPLSRLGAIIAIASIASSLTWCSHI